MVNGINYSTLRTAISLRFATPMTTFSEQGVLGKIRAPQKCAHPAPQNLSVNMLHVAKEN